MATRHSDAFYRFFGTLANTRVVTRLHPPVYRLMGGRGPIGQNVGLNVVLMTTGRQSGQAREAPLLAFRDGDRIVIVASKNGSDREPGWIWNLRADPAARLRVGGEVRPVHAYEAEGDERDRLWARAVDLYRGYDLYQRKTARRIPVVVLEPAGTA